MTRRETGFLDSQGREIYEGDVLRFPVTGNQQVHGTWTDKRVVYRNGMWVAEYLISETGEQLPPGYTAGELSEYRAYEGKELYFTQNDHYRTLTVTLTDKPELTDKWDIPSVAERPVSDGFIIQAIRELADESPEDFQDKVGKLVYLRRMPPTVTPEEAAEKAIRHWVITPDFGTPAEKRTPVELLDGFAPGSGQSIYDMMVDAIRVSQGEDIQEDNNE